MSDIAFSLDLQEKHTRVIDVRPTGDKIELLSMGVKDTVPSFFSTDNPQILQRQAETLLQLYSSLKLKKKTVDVVIPDSLTYSQIVPMPQLKEKELLSAIRYQSDEFIPMPIDETNLDIEILREDPATKKQLVLIVAAPKRIVSQIEKTIEMAGLTPGMLENEVTSFARLYSEKFARTKKINASIILNLGYLTSSLYLIDNTTGTMLYSRTFKVGLDLFNRSVKVNLNMDDKKTDEALRTIGLSKNGTIDLATILTPLFNEVISEIQKFVSLAQERFNIKVDSIFTYNYDSHIAFLDKHIEEYTKIPTATFPLQTMLVQNPVSQTFSSELSSFVSVIAASL